MEAKDKKDPTKKAPILVKEISKVTAVQLEQILDRTLKVSRLLQSKFGSQDKFDKELKDKVKFDTYGNVSAEELESFFGDVCKDNLNKREIARKDLEGFLSSLTYNRYKMTNLNVIPQHVFSDDTQISKKIYALERPMPPPASIAEKFIEKTEGKEPVTEERMRNLIKELQHKSFENKKYIYSVFKDFDHDCDGYISYNDVKEQFKKLKISSTDAEIKRFIEMADTQQQGYLDFRNFSAVVTPNMADSMVPLERNEENDLFKRDRQNLVPNMQKIQENINYHKTFTDKFNAIKEQFVPDQNMQLSKQNTIIVHII